MLFHSFSDGTATSVFYVSDSGIDPTITTTADSGAETPETLHIFVSGRPTITVIEPGHTRTPIDFGTSLDFTLPGDTSSSDIVQSTSQPTSNIAAPSIAPPPVSSSNSTSGQNGTGKQDQSGALGRNEFGTAQLMALLVCVLAGALTL